MSTSITSATGAMDPQSMADQNRQRMQSVNGAAASYLGLSQQALHTQLEAGKSMAEVATAQGKSVDGLKSALSSAMQTNRSTATTASPPRGPVPNGIDYIVNGQRGPVPNGIDYIVNAKHPIHHGGHGGARGTKGGQGPIMSPLAATDGSSTASSSISTFI